MSSNLTDNTFLSTGRLKQWGCWLLAASLVIPFILCHSNQNSAQSSAFVVFALAPLGLFCFSTPANHREFMLFNGIFLAFGLNAFLTYFKGSPGLISFETARGLIFYFLAPLAIATFWTIKIRPGQVFWLVVIAAVISLYPVILDIIEGNVRGKSSTHPIFWGNIALSTGFIGFVLSYYYDKKIYRILGVIVLFCGLAASMWSQSRGGWIALPVALGFLLLNGYIRSKHLVLFSLLLVVIVVSNGILFDRVGKTVAIEEGQAENIKFDDSSWHRLIMWQFGLSCIPKEPVFGLGLDGYYYCKLKAVEEGEASKAIKPYEHAHNEYIEILVSRGFVGFALLGFMQIWLYRVYSRYKREPKLKPFAIAGQLHILLYAVFSLTEIFFTNRLTIIYYCLTQAILISTIWVESAREDEVCTRL